MSLFVHVDSGMRRGPRWATPLIVALCIACFVVLSWLPAAQAVAVARHWGTVPVRLFSGTGSWWQAFVDPDWVCLLTSLFIHLSWMHLAANMLFLMIFGLSAERAMGSRRFLCLFLFSGVFANLIGALTLSTAHAPIIGCSGAVSAVVGVYLVLFPHARLGLVLPLGLFMEFVRVPASLLISLWVLLQLLFTYAGPSFGAVVWWSHIAGFLFGVVFAFGSRQAVQRRRYL